MPSPPAIDQAIRFARRATPWVVGPIVFVLRGPTTDLAPASRCGGALDLLSMVVVGARPSLYVGTLFTTFQAVALILAFGFLGSLVLRTSGSLAIALAVTAALAISQPFDSGLALPASAMAFAACAAAALVLRAWTEKGEHHRSTLRACAAVFVAASIVPAWTTMCAFLTFGLVARGRASEARRRRVLIASIAAAVSVGVPVGIAAIVNRAGPSPRVASCVLPGSPISFASLSNAVDATGPLVLALAALGGYAVALAAGQVIGLGWPNAHTLKNAYLSEQKPVPNSGHAVTLVGYRTATGRMEDAVFIFKNSWGKDWGQGGYGIATYGYLKKTIQTAVILEVQRS